MKQGEKIDEGAWYELNGNEVKVSQVIGGRVFYAGRGWPSNINISEESFRIQAARVPAQVVPVAELTTGDRADLNAALDGLWGAVDALAGMLVCDESAAPLSKAQDAIERLRARWGLGS